MTIRAKLSAATAVLGVVSALSASAQPYPSQTYPGQAYPAQTYPGAGPSRPRPYEEAYKAGYRAGYQAGRQRGRYDDQPAPVSSFVDPDQRWRQRYGQTYTYNDDHYYQECRSTADPAGVIAGALIGGLIGNAAGRGGGRAGATVAGVVVGGALGAGLTKRLDCEDRSYAYKTYYDGFNSGRPNSNWQWDNPRNGHYGDFRVGDYYNDPDGFRCASYTQQVYVDGVPQTANGRACQQPDGAWTIVN
jgi:surface antigen